MPHPLNNVVPPFASAAVAAAFASVEPTLHPGLLALRALIFEVAAELPEAGPIEETLKWGQPAYLTPVSKSGSTIRLGAPKKTGGYALYTHCQTTLMADFQSVFPEDFSYEGHRAIHFEADAPLQPEKLRLLIKRALTYHSSRRGAQAPA